MSVDCAFGGLERLDPFRESLVDSTLSSFGLETSTLSLISSGESEYVGA